MSPGGCDEFIRLFACVKSVTQDKLEELEGKLTGNLEEGETICLKIVPLDEVWKICYEAKALSSLFLYQKYLASQS
jgi:ADP-sugar diphosphatase